jgi:hypothetical protein
MVKPELRSHRQGFSATPALHRRQQKLFFHADVPEQARAKLVVGLALYPAGMSGGSKQQSIETPVVFCEEICDQAVGMGIHYFSPSI